MRLTALLFLLAACSGPTTDDTGSDSDTDTDTDSDTDTDTDTDTDLRTLDNCATQVDSDTPQFFQDLYRCATVQMAGDYISIQTIDLPPHPSPYYPESDPNWEAFDTRGGTHMQNPNTLSEQDETVLVPVTPVSRGLTITQDLVDLSAGTSPYEYPGGNGVGLDGTLIFAAMAAPGDDITQEDQTFDQWEAHPQNTGVYHHHGPNPGGLAVLQALGFTTTDVPGSAEVEIYGIMCDGTVLLGCTEADGSDPDSSDFDAQNGHVHDIVADDGTVYFSGRYHTHVCSAYSHQYMPEIQYYEGCSRPAP